MIANIRDYYKNDLLWSAGPHLFIDEDEIYGMCDLRKKGVHAVSFNKTAIGIEVLGDYDGKTLKAAGVWLVGRMPRLPQASSLTGSIWNPTKKPFFFVAMIRKR